MFGLLTPTGEEVEHEAAKCVQTLNIMNSKELDVPSARHFAKVEEVNLLCFLVYDTNGNHDLDYETVVYTLSTTTATNTVPFLSAFPKLRKLQV
mmetsp:Transcript_4760/g.7423  ORF Transcript_4760/g.7423 Transcript_4760/m.7423 type:complete len:94 (-) Transcript_4760:190-471(-)